MILLNRGAVPIYADFFSEPGQFQAQAVALYDDADDALRAGDYKRALNLFQRSIEFYPTPEAYCMLGWTWSFLARLDLAIRFCKKAIGLDPNYGNPYNDIGAYLMEQGKLDEAFIWLKKATRAPRYKYRHYPWYNLGRLYEYRGDVARARDCFLRALAINPDAEFVRKALQKLQD